MGNSISALAPFVLLSIFTRKLSVAEFGELAVFQSLIIGLSAFIGINTIGAANRNFYEEGSHEDNKLYNTACFNIFFISVFIVASALLLFWSSLNDWVDINNEWIAYAIVIASVNYVLGFRLGQWQIREQSTPYAITQVTNSMFNMLLSIVFVVLMNQGSEGRVISQLISSLIILGICLYFIKVDDLIKYKLPRYEDIIRALSFGVPLIPHVFGMFLLSAVDRLIISNKMGLESAGIYLVAFQVSMGLVLVFDALNKACIPWLYNNLNSSKHSDKLKVVKYTYCAFISLVVIAVFSYFISPKLLLILAGDKYIESCKYVGLLFVGQIFSGMYLIVTNYLFYSKRTGILSLITIFSGTINIVLILAFIENYGLMAVSWSFVISRFIQFILVWYASSKFIDMPWAFEKNRVR